MERKFKILYVDMGGVTPYSLDKTGGRIMGWAEGQNDVVLLAPQLIGDTAQKEICAISKFPERIKIITLPFSNKKRISGLGIIFSYFLRILFSPAVLFKNIPKFDIGYSNSPVLVDIIPILILKLFGKCRHWVLMADSIVPLPQKRSGSHFINVITYWESRLVLVLAHFFSLTLFTVNPELKKEIVRLGIPEKKVLLSKNGLFMNRIDTVIRNSGEKIYSAAYMGRITENKGVFDLIPIWKAVVKAKPGAKLAIMGTGRADVVARFREGVRENGLGESIVYLGYVGGNQKYEVLKSSKIFLYLSQVNADESWGISLMEALACGLPSLTYDLAIYQHIYPEGILQKSHIGDLHSVVDRGLSLLSDSKEYESISAQSASFAKQFDWFQVAREDLSEIHSIINDRKI